MTIRVLKTDQQRKGGLLDLGPCVDCELCPVATVSWYLTLRRMDTGALLQHQDRAPLPKYQFWTLTSRAWDLLGLKGVKFETHLFWIREASVAATMGYTLSRIREIG